MEHINHILQNLAVAHPNTEPSMQSIIANPDIGGIIAGYSDINSLFNLTISCRELEQIVLDELRRRRLSTAGILGAVHRLPLSLNEMRIDLQYQDRFDWLAWRPVAAGAFGYSLVVRSGKIYARESATAEVAGTLIPMPPGVEIQNVYRSDCDEVPDTDGEGEGDEVPDTDGEGEYIPIMRNANVAICKKGDVYRWGNSKYCNFNVPMKIESLENINTVALGSSHCLAVSAQGRLFSWGDNSHGQCGHRNRTQQLTRISVPCRIDGDLIVRTAAAGSCHSLIVTTDQNIFAFGSNVRGQLGLGSHIQNQYVPKRVQLPLFVNVQAVAAGSYHSIALAAGSIFSWGDNSYNQIGLGLHHATMFHHVIIYEPVRIPALGHEAASIGVGFNSSFVVTTKGELYTWGEIECAPYTRERINDNEFMYVKPKSRKPLRLIQAHANVASVSFGNIIVVTDEGFVLMTHTDSDADTSQSPTVYSWRTMDTGMPIERQSIIRSGYGHRN